MAIHVKPPSSSRGAAGAVAIHGKLGFMDFLVTTNYTMLTHGFAGPEIIASMMMLPGWCIIAVPTGIVSSEMTARRFARQPTTRTCPECLSEGHETNARFCKDCGVALPPHARD